MKLTWVLIFVLGFWSCVKHFDEGEVYGLYTSSDYKNNFDTIQLLPKGMYHRKVYGIDKKLLLKIDGQWELVEQKSKIQIDGFYMNLDDDLVAFSDLAKDTNMLMISALETHEGAIRFCTGHSPGENCYQKVK